MCCTVVTMIRDADTCSATATMETRMVRALAVMM